MRTFAFASVLIALCLAPTLARADAVRPPPRNCPAGSHGETGHAGPYCTPSACLTDAECVGYPGQVCSDAPLCVKSVSYTDWSGQTYTRLEVVGPCASDGSCADPASKCDMTKKCTPPSTTTTSTGPSGSTGAGASSTSSGAQSGAGGAGTGGEGTGADEDRRIDGCGCGIPASAPGAASWAMMALAVAAAVRRAGARRRTER
jgi:hypothetical protein